MIKEKIQLNVYPGNQKYEITLSDVLRRKIISNLKSLKNCPTLEIKTTEFGFKEIVIPLSEKLRLFVYNEYVVCVNDNIRELFYDAERKIQTIVIEEAAKKYFEIIKNYFVISQYSIARKHKKAV